MSDELFTGDHFRTFRRDDLIARREDPDTDPGSIAWVTEVLDEEKAAAVGAYITTRSYQFSADVLALSGDGRAFRSRAAAAGTAG